MKPEDFDYVAQMLKTRSGLVLTKDKSYLLESRLMPVARKRGFKGLEDLVAQLRRRDEAVAADVTEAMATNQSHFLPHMEPVGQVPDVVLPNLIKTRAAKKSFRVWCAAASSGQEPYSLAIILKEASARLQGWRTEVVGTDIRRELLQ